MKKKFVQRTGSHSYTREYSSGIGKIAMLELGLS